MLTASEIAEKWARNTGNSSQAMTEGVNAVTTSPMAKAAARQDAWLAGIQRAAASGKWRDGLMKVDLAEWKKSMIEKGIPNVLRGVTAAKPKFQRFMVNLLAHIATIKRELESIPRGDFQQNVNRMILNATRMRDFNND